MSNNETFDTPNLIKFFKNTFISNVRKFFQVLHDTLPLKSIIESHTTWCVFSHWAVANIKKQVNPLTPNDPWEATPWEKIKHD